VLCERIEFPSIDRDMLTGRFRSGDTLVSLDDLSAVSTDARMPPADDVPLRSFGLRKSYFIVASRFFDGCLRFRKLAVP